MIEKMIKQEKQDGDVFSLYNAIALASAEFPPLPKTKSVSYKSIEFDYAPYHVVMKCIKPTLAKYGVAVMQAVHTEREGFMSMTLVVAGHGAMLASTIEFPHKKEIKEFGADVTYYKRYQVCSFFCLEGDPDADDFDLQESNIQRQSEHKPVKNSGETLLNNVEDKTSNNNEEPSPKSEPKQVKTVHPQPVSERLTYAMKQLKWKMEDFNKFCEANSEHFPNFVSAAKLDDKGKEILWNLLIDKAGVIPF